ncbi:MAG: type II toxin-antitoxin system Phd/YefM family antitoxin [Gammaproteobacteria bacterium]
MQVNILEAKNRLSQLIKSVQAGKEVIIANRGEPVARLVATKSAGATHKRDLVRWLKEHPQPTHARRSAAEIDAAIAAERDAWD